VRAIEELGASVEMVSGSYDDAVARADARARECGWVVVSDTAYPGYEEIPRQIMQGYTVMVREALEQLPAGSIPTHAFAQAGVGGLAAAVTGHLWESLGRRRPWTVVVEPAEADGLLESALRGRPTPSRGSLVTSLDCLACRNVSTQAWVILESGADAFLTISDRAAEETVGLLAYGLDGDPPVRSRPSGVAGLAGLIAALFEPSLSTPLDLTRDSRVLIFGSEGP
jgi:diaminopropionate ammonia-lyase